MIKLANLINSIKYNDKMRAQMIVAKMRLNKLHVVLIF